MEDIESSKNDYRYLIDELDYDDHLKEILKEKTSELIEIIDNLKNYFNDLRLNLENIDYGNNIDYIIFNNNNNNNNIIKKLNQIEIKDEPQNGGTVIAKKDEPQESNKQQNGGTVIAKEDGPSLFSI